MRPWVFLGVLGCPGVIRPRPCRRGNGSFRSYSRSDPGSFRSYSRSDPGSFRSYSLSVRSFRPGSFRPDFRGGSFRPNFGGSFRPTLFYIVFSTIKKFFLLARLILCSYNK